MKRIVLFTLVTLLVALISVDIVAQCPMCKMAAQSNLENGGTEGRGLNFGILYMFALPYLLISIIGYMWWKNKKEETS